MKHILCHLQDGNQISGSSITKFNWIIEDNERRKWESWHTSNNVGIEEWNNWINIYQYKYPLTCWISKSRFAEEETLDCYSSGICWRQMRTTFKLTVRKGKWEEMRMSDEWMKFQYKFQIIILVDIELKSERHKLLNVEKERRIENEHQREYIFPLPSLKFLSFLSYPDKQVFLPFHSLSSFPYRCYKLHAKIERIKDVKRREKKTCLSTSSSPFFFLFFISFNMFTWNDDLHSFYFLSHIFCFIHSCLQLSLHFSYS